MIIRVDSGVLQLRTESTNNNTFISAVVKVETDSTVVFTFTNITFAQKKKRNCLNDHCFFP